MKLTGQDFRRVPLVLLLSMLGAYASAFTFVVVFKWSLPPSDLAYGQGVFEDRLVWEVALWFASISGLFVFLPAFFVVRGRKLVACFALALGCVLSEIVVVTPLLGPSAIPGAFFALAVAFLACRRSKAWVFRPTG